MLMKETRALFTGNVSICNSYGMFGMMDGLSKYRVSICYDLVPKVFLMKTSRIITSNTNPKITCALMKETASLSTGNVSVCNSEGMLWMMDGFPPQTLAFTPLRGSFMTQLLIPRERSAKHW